MNEKKFSVGELDVLREISNIGMGNAVTSLSQLINRRVEMRVPRARFFSLEQVVEMAGGYEELVACVSLRLLGDVTGLILFLFDEESTYCLVDMLMDLPDGTTGFLDEFSQSAVKEVGNVLTGSFVSAINQMTGLHMIPAVPLFAFDMLAAVLSSLIAATGRTEDMVLVIQTELLPQKEKPIKGQFFLLADTDSVDKLISALL